MDWLLLDFDGVLGQRSESRSDIVAKKLNLDRKLVRDFYDHGYKAIPELDQEAWAIRNQADEIDFYTHVFMELTKKYHVTIGNIDFSELAKTFVEVPFELIPGVDLALKVLKQKYRLGIFSNAHATRRDHELTYLNILRIFDIILISGEKEYDKSSLQFYRDAITATGVDAGLIRLVDNDINPLLMATQAGFEKGVLIAPELSKEWETFPDLASMAAMLSFESRE